MISFGWEKWFHEFPIVQVEPISGSLGCCLEFEELEISLTLTVIARNVQVSAHSHIEQFNLAVEFSTLYNFISQMVWTMWIQIIVNSLTIKGTKIVFPLKMGDWKNVSEVACVILARLQTLWTSFVSHFNGVKITNFIPLDFWHIVILGKWVWVWVREVSLGHNLKLHFVHSLATKFANFLQA